MLFISNSQLDGWSKKGCFTVHARWCKIQAQDMLNPNYYSNNLYEIVRKFSSWKVVKKDVSSLDGTTFRKKAFNVSYNKDSNTSYKS